ncbi:unnamed protein product [Lota lota]
MPRRLPLEDGPPHPGWASPTHYCVPLTPQPWRWNADGVSRPTWECLETTERRRRCGPRWFHKARDPARASHGERQLVSVHACEVNGL